jgi:hypothetical protein
MVEIQFFAAGYCKQLHNVIFPKEEAKQVRFYALYALLKHPKAGCVLFDTGYAEHYFQATQHFPYKLYDKLVPVYLEPTESAAKQLEQQGISNNVFLFPTSTPTT